MERLTATKNGVTVYVGPGCEYDIGMIPAELGAEHIRQVLTRLAVYEDIGLMPEEIIGLCSMDRRAKMAELLRMEESKPLTSDELLKMDGTPVWITKMDGSGGVWMLVDAEYKLCREAHGEMAVFENGGKTWTARRHKMEPDEIRSLLQTDAGGFHKKLPCKEGDPVWWINAAWLPGNGPMFYKIDSGKFRYAMLDWQNPVYTSQAAAEAALAEMAKEGTTSEKSHSD